MQSVLLHHAIGVTNPLAFFNSITSWVDVGRAVLAYLDSSKVSDAVSHNILVMKLSKYGIDEWKVKWWLIEFRVVISGVEFSWRL